MEFLTLDSSFQKQETIDDFISAIWTERYTKTGDINLIVAPTLEMREKLAEGTFVQLEGSDEVALIDTALIEDGVLKVTGNFLDEFLNERIIHISPLHSEKSVNIDATSPSNGMIKLVQGLVVAGGAWTSSSAPGSIDGSHQIITNLSLADPPSSGYHILSLGSTQLSVPYGPLYDALQQIAETYQVGFKIYLAYAHEGGGYSLVFKTWLGQDRTSGQSVNPVITFSPDMDSLTNIKELRSIANYKTVAYAYATSDPNNLASDYGFAEAYPGAGNQIDFSRRNLLVFVDDIPETVIDAPGMKTILDQRAKDALANNNYVKVVDGEVIPNEFSYGEDYGLGDVVELNSGTGIIQNARITEYIRSQDNTGERAYPTVTVL